MYDGVKKQQPVKIGDENILHDSRGNVIRTSAYNITWSSYSKPLTILTNRTLSAFEYGPNRERIIKFSKSVTNQKTLIYYVEDVYEKWISIENNTAQITEKFYIKVLNKIIATKVVTRSGERLFYMYNDAYGSVESIHDEKGALLLKYTYTSFGYRTTSYSNISADLQPFLNSGYGSNDYIDDERLIFFKGRIYDCVFARFLSPDPFIQEPYNIQNLNRYSYSLNNPFKYNDPSGFWFKKLWKTGL
jgi:RHS repeat-associated protein